MAFFWTSRPWLTWRPDRTDKVFSKTFWISCWESSCIYLLRGAASVTPAIAPAELVAHCRSSAFHSAGFGYSKKEPFVRDRSLTRRDRQLNAVVRSAQSRKLACLRYRVMSWVREGMRCIFLLVLAICQNICNKASLFGFASERLVQITSFSYLARDVNLGLLGPDDAYPR